MDEELKRLAEEYGWLELSPRENLRNAMWQIGEAMVSDRPSMNLIDAAVALYCVLSVNGTRLTAAAPLGGFDLEYVMYKSALAGTDMARNQNPMAHAHMALITCLGCIQDSRQVVAKQVKAVVATMKKEEKKEDVKPAAE